MSVNISVSGAMQKGKTDMSASLSDVDVIEPQEETTHSVVQPMTVPDSPDSPKLVERKFPVIEIFGPVFQGEGSQAGQQTLFIRFGGCDYRCQKCDSMHAVEPKAIKKHARYLTAEEIAQECWSLKKDSGVHWVTLSGGNPAMHQLDFLTKLLRDLGFSLNVETQGTIWQDWFYICNQVTLSPKGPGMGEKFEPDKFLLIIDNLISYHKPICIKVVVFNQMDLEFAIQLEELVKSYFATRYIMTPTISWYLSLGNMHPPVLNESLDLVEDQTWGSIFEHLPLKLLDQYRALAEDILPDARLSSWRFLPQVHVLAYSNEGRR